MRKKMEVTLTSKDYRDDAFVPPKNKTVRVITCGTHPNFVSEEDADSDKAREEKAGKAFPFKIHEEKAQKHVAGGGVHNLIETVKVVPVEEAEPVE